MNREPGKEKTGLVLEGGAMRGMFSAGAMDVLMEAGITFDGAVGVSAGATFGCNYKSGQIGRAFRYNSRYAGDKRYCSFRSLLFTGNLYNARFCYDTLPNRLDLFDVDAFARNPMEFYVVVTDVETGAPVYHRLDRGDAEDLAWMRASASMPLVSRPVELDGRRYLDGGISDSVPLEFFERQGYRKNVVILTQPQHYVKTPARAMPLIRLFWARYPALAAAMARRHQVYNRETAYVFRRREEGAAFVLCPGESLGIRRTEKNPDELRRVYETGRKTAQENLTRLTEFLAADPPR